MGISVPIDIRICVPGFIRVHGFICIVTILVIVDIIGRLCARGLECIRISIAVLIAIAIESGLNPFIYLIVAIFIKTVANFWSARIDRSSTIITITGGRR